MAFYAHFKNGKGMTWHVSKLTSAILVDTEIENMIYLQADGDELEHIQKQYTTYHTATSPHTRNGYSIPMPLNIRVVRWYGDLGKSIAFNL